VAGLNRSFQDARLLIIPSLYRSRDLLLSSILPPVTTNRSIVLLYSKPLSLPPKNHDSTSLSIQSHLFKSWRVLRTTLLPEPTPNPIPFCFHSFVQWLVLGPTIAFSRRRTFPRALWTTTATLGQPCFQILISTQLPGVTR